MNERREGAKTKTKEEFSSDARARHWRLFSAAGGMTIVWITRRRGCRVGPCDFTTSLAAVTSPWPLAGWLWLGQSLARATGCSQTVAHRRVGISIVRNVERRPEVSIWCEISHEVESLKR
jgi:hypothetical protein